MRLVLAGLFFIVAMALYGGTNYYIGIRVWNGVFKPIPFINAKVYWVFFWIIAATYILYAVLQRYSWKIVTIFQTIGGYWMAAMLYLFMLFIVLDILRFVIGRMNFSFTRYITSSSVIHTITTILLVLGFVAIFIYGRWNASHAEVTDYKISIDKSYSSNNLKVVMVSDIHLGTLMTKDRLKTMVKEINKLKPDVILMSGDIIDGSIQPFIDQDMASDMKNLKSKYGTYAVLGNHEGFNTDINKVVKEYEKGGITVIRDKAILVDNSFYIVGRDDVSMNKDRLPLDKIMENVDRSKPILMMDHQPREFDKAKTAGVDLMVSGHTHRGQLAPLNLVTSKIFELDYGYLKKGNLNVVVSSGYGTWGPPIRLGSRSEIVEINISCKPL